MTLAILSALAEEQHGLVDAMQGMQCLRHAGRDKALAGITSWEEVMRVTEQQTAEND